MAMSYMIAAVVLMSQGSMMLTQGACLKNATPKQDRQDVTIDGVAGPLGLHKNSWTTTQILTELFKIVAEEELGYNVNISTEGKSSGSAFWALAGCPDGPCTLTGKAVSKTHVSVEVWEHYIGNALGEVTAKFPERLPSRVGKVGYVGTEGTFLRTDVMTNGEAQGLILDFYKGYHKNKDPGQGFDNFDLAAKFPTEKFSKCSVSKPFKEPTTVNNFVKIYNDTQAATCVSNGADVPSYWWFSPACRAASERSKCVPFLTYNGFGAEVVMHQAVEFDMPVAVASVIDNSDFRPLAMNAKSLFFCFLPNEDCLGFEITKMQGPPYSADEYNKGKKSSDPAEQPLYTYAHKDLKIAAPKVYKTAENMQITMNQIMGMLDAATTSNPKKTPAEVACEFLVQNPSLYKSWIPDKRACGVGQGLIDDACEFCPQAKYSIRHPNISGAGLCVECPSGKHQDLMGSSECKTCEAGKYSLSGKASCSFCPRGNYSSEGQGLCTSCPANTTTATIASETISSCICDSGFYNAKGECKACPTGSSTDEIGSKSVESCMCQTGWYMLKDTKYGCQPCAHGMSCEKGSSMKNYDDYRQGIHDVKHFPKNAPGFMSTPDEPLSVYDCQSEKRCPGGIPGKCGANAAGISCGACKDEYYGTTETCHQCGSSATAVVLFPTIPAVLLPIIFLGLYWLFRDEPARWGSWQNALISLAYLMLTHYQMASIVGSTDVSLPAGAEPMWHVWDCTTDVTSFFNKDCAGFAGFQSKFVLTSLGPLIVLLYAVVLYGVSLFVNPLLKKEPLQFDRMNNVFFSLIYTFFPGIVDMSLSLFMCHKNPNGKDTLLQDRTVVCGEEEWKSMLGVAIVAVLFYCVFCLAIFVWVVCHVRRSDMAFLMRWKFLFIKYRMGVHWWGLAILFKAVALIFGIVVIEGSLQQLSWVMAMCSIYLILLSVYSPWRARSANILDCAVNVNIIALCGVFMWFAPSGHDAVSAAQTMAMVFVCVPLGYFVIGGVFVMTPFINQYVFGAELPSNVEAVEIKRISQIFAEMGVADISATMQKTAQQDASFVKQALSALEREKPESSEVDRID